jgi:hypothetical protein
VLWAILACSHAAAASPAMVCQSDHVWRWDADGSVKRLEVIGLIQALDGRLYGLRWHDDHKSVTRMDDPSADAIDVFWNSGDHEVVIENDTSMLADSPRVLRGKDWVFLRRADQIATRFRGATVLDKRWWIALDDGVWRTTKGDRLEQVAPVIKQPRAIAAVGTSVWVLEVQEGKAVLWELPASGAPKQRATQPLTGTGDHAGLATASVKGVVAMSLHGRGDEGPVFLISAGKATLIATDALQLGSVDGAGRVWYQRRDGLVAREASGHTVVYPSASMELIATARGELRCYPFGGGFLTLPAPGPLLTEELTLDLKAKGGDPSSEIVVCDALRSREPHEKVPCANDPARITGKLDAHAMWKQRVPIGDYTFGVKLGDGWFVSPGEHCELQVGKPCTLGARK